MKAEKQYWYQRHEKTAACPHSMRITSSGKIRQVIKSGAVFCNVFGDGVGVFCVDLVVWIGFDAPKPDGKYTNYI